MIKGKKLMMTLAALTLIIALMASGCSAVTEVEALPGEEYSINANGNIGSEEQEVKTEDPADEDQIIIDVDGTVKAFDAATGLMTIAIQDGDKLELKITGDSEIYVRDSPAAADELYDAIGTEVSVEYSFETNAVTKINVRG